MAMEVAQITKNANHDAMRALKVGLPSIETLMLQGTFFIETTRNCKKDLEKRLWLMKQRRFCNIFDVGKIAIPNIMYGKSFSGAAIEDV